MDDPHGVDQGVDEDKHPEHGKQVNVSQYLHR
jgi:hypothetical protein